MTVLFITNFVPRKRGGFEHLLSALGAELRERGHRFVLALAGEPKGGGAELLAKVESGPLKVKTAPSSSARSEVQGQTSNVAERSDAPLECRVIPGWGGAPVAKTTDYGLRTTDSRERTNVQSQMPAPRSLAEAGSNDVAPDAPASDLRPPTSALSPVRPWAMVLPTIKLIRELKPDVCVVHFGNELPSLLTLWLSRLMGSRAKWVWQQDQQIAAPSRMASYASRLRALCLGFCRYVAVSEAGRESMLARRLPKERVVVIPNSAPWGKVESEKLRVESRSGAKIPMHIGMGYPSLASTSDTSHVPLPTSYIPTVITVSSLIRRKRLDLALQAVALAKRDGQCCTLVIVGDGELRDILMKQARELGIGDDVRFLGLRDDVAEVMAESDLYLHTADAEGCSYAILESMAAGLPAVVTDCGAAPEQVADGVSGFVVPCGDAEAIAERLTQLLGDAEKRKSFGRAAKERWSAEFRTEVAAKRYADLYESLF